MTAARATAEATHARAIVEVDGVSKIYPGGTEALNHVSLDFPEGQLTTLLGPSGCGKTTMLKIIAGLLPATGGEVRVDGRTVTGPGTERAFVFQDFALLSVENVTRTAVFGLEMGGLGTEQRM